MSIQDLQQSIPICAAFAALGGILEVFATAVLAYPAARIVQGHTWTDQQLRVCLGINIVLQIVASLAGNLFATWFGPVAIVGPIFFAAQLLANLVVFWTVLGIEAFSRDMQIGTYVVVVSVVLLLVNGPGIQDYGDATFDELVSTLISAVWCSIQVVGMLLTGIVLVVTAKIGDGERFNRQRLWVKVALLLVARSSAFSLNLSAGKALILPTSPEWFAMTMVIKIVSGAIYTMAIVVQSTAVEQKMFVPINAATTLLVNAATGLIVWRDYNVVSSWLGYACVFLLLGLGCALLLSDLGLLQETAPETFRGGRLGMTLRANREQLLDNLRNIGQRQSEGVVSNTNSDMEENAMEASLKASSRLNAWTAVYETGRAAVKDTIAARTVRFRQTYHGAEAVVPTGDGQPSVLNRTWSGPFPSRVQTALTEATNSIQASPTGPSPAPPAATSVDSSPNAPPSAFKYTKGVCALSWWRPIKLLEEGSISDIHLVVPRKQFLTVSYKEKRNVMELAKSNFIFSRNRAGDEDEQDEEKLRVLKSIMKDHVGEDEVLEEMRSEILVMSHLEHPNIVKLYEAYERRRHIYLVMEYCPGGNLTNRHYNEGQTKDVIRKILSAVAYMHSKGVAHRDLKLENVMLDRNGDIKIIDFGLATKYLGMDYSNMTETVGTLYSMAPEILEGKVYDYKCDIWSIGIVTYLLLSQGIQPFWGPVRSMPWEQRRRVMIDCIRKVQYAPMRGKSWDGISHVAKNFVKSLLQHNPNDRPTAAQALASEWLKNAPSADSSLKDNSGTATARSEIDVSISNHSIAKGQEHVSTFRRKAWRVLTTNRTLTDADTNALQRGFEKVDRSGRGFIDLNDFLKVLHQSHLVLSEKDLESLRNEQSAFMEEKDDDAPNTQLNYIDFMGEVKRGRRRNILDNLALVLDNMDTDNSHSVSTQTILPVLNLRFLSFEIQEELREKLINDEFLFETYGKVSTSQLLKWVDKKMKGIHNPEHEKIV